MLPPQHLEREDILKTSIAFRGVAACALICSAAAVTQGATIIKLNLGGVGPDVGMNSVGIFSTVDQTAGPPPTGDQFTDVRRFAVG